MNMCVQYLAREETGNNKRESHSLIGLLGGHPIQREAMEKARLSNSLVGDGCIGSGFFMLPDFSNRVQRATLRNKKRCRFN
jgi:hypothetical protein